MPSQPGHGMYIIQLPSLAYTLMINNVHILNGTIPTFKACIHVHTCIIIIIIKLHAMHIMYVQSDMVDGAYVRAQVYVCV